ncbi:MAG: protein adenylyltransferase SelO [Pseudohongiellaceae bacterium]
MNACSGSLPPLDNRFVNELPGDPVRENRVRQVSGACWSQVAPKHFPAARLLAWSRELGAELGFSPDTLGAEAFTSILSGNRSLDGQQPYAMCYGGHQFGHWAGQLGDGRAINLGDVIQPDGRHQVLQLKGAGPTPYSRTADGLAVLRSSVREFLCSEAMHHLGVPTTRALSLVLTGEQVLRDMFYDGNPELEPGAIICRVAPSFVRFGSFEIFSARDEHEVMKQLADFTIRHDYPHLLERPEAAVTKEHYCAWFHEICQRTATLIVHWMRVGFVHGVMNTDNMSILGLTIDYGPYGWLEGYDPYWTPNTTDAQGRRYRFGAQPQIALWNLVQLANALYPLIGDVPALEAAIAGFKQAYEAQWLTMMRAKLGLPDVAADDAALIEQLLQSFRHVETDMTLFFRGLAAFDPCTRTDGDPVPGALQHSWYDPTPDATVHSALGDWLARYRQRLQGDPRPASERASAMNQVNPLYVPRNWLAQLAIDDIAEHGSTSKLDELMQVLSAPYTEQGGKEHLAQKRPEWARQRAGCSMLSCSS